MANKELTQKIGNKNYKFKITNRTIRKLDEKYGNCASILYGVMYGVQFYTNCLKLISGCCTTKEKTLVEKEDGVEKYEEQAKDWTLEELEDNLTPAQYTLQIGDLAKNLYINYMGFGEEKEEKDKGKN